MVGVQTHVRPRGRAAAVLASASLLLLLVLVAEPVPVEASGFSYDAIKYYQNDYYGALGVSKSASLKEIKKAYRALALEWHPDKNKSEGAKERFNEIRDAYEVLKDDDKRKAYDDAVESLPARFRPRYGSSPVFSLRSVVLFLLTTSSAIHYFLRYQAHLSFRRRIKRSPWFKAKEKEYRKKYGADPPEDLIDQVEIVGARNNQSGMPTWRDILAVQLVLLPFRAVRRIGQEIRFFYLYSYKKLEMSEEDRRWWLQARFGITPELADLMEEKKREKEEQDRLIAKMQRDKRWSRKVKLR